MEDFKEITDEFWRRSPANGKIGAAKIRRRTVAKSVVAVTARERKKNLKKKKLKEKESDSILLCRSFSTSGFVLRF